MSTAVMVRDFAGTGTECQVDVSDMLSGELTVQHILDSAGMTSEKSAVLVDGSRISDMATMVAPGSEILMIPQVANG